MPSSLDLALMHSTHMLAKSLLACLLHVALVIWYMVFIYLCLKIPQFEECEGSDSQERLGKNYQVESSPDQQ